MKTILTTAIAAAIVCASAPAFAQGAMMADKANTMTCQQMMDKSMSMPMNSSMTMEKKAMMKSEMDMAKKAMAMKDEMACKMHMQKAMSSM